MKKIKSLVIVCLGVFMLISNIAFAQNPDSRTITLTTQDPTPEPRVVTYTCYTSDIPCQKASLCCGYTIWLVILTLALAVIAFLLYKIYMNQKNMKSNAFAAKEESVTEPNATVESEEEVVHTQASTLVSTPSVTQRSTIGDEEYAAIAAAIYMYNNELHDEENTILTINRISKAYSPWSSKLYNMNTYYTKRR